MSLQGVYGERSLVAFYLAEGGKPYTSNSVVTIYRNITESLEAARWLGLKDIRVLPIELPASLIMMDDFDWKVYVWEMDRHSEIATLPDWIPGSKKITKPTERRRVLRLRRSENP